MPDMEQRFPAAEPRQLAGYVYESRDGATTLVGPRMEAVLRVEPDVVVLERDKLLKITVEFRPTRGGPWLPMEVLATLPATDTIIHRSHPDFEFSPAGETGGPAWVARSKVSEVLGEFVARPGLVVEIRTNFPDSANRSALLRLV